MTSIRTFNELLMDYDNFKKAIPEDFASRLYEELMLVRKLIIAANMQKLDVDTFEYQKIADDNLKQLHKMGYNRIE